MVTFTEVHALAPPRALLTRRAVIWAADALSDDDTSVNALAGGSASPGTPCGARSRLKPAAGPTIPRGCRGGVTRRKRAHLAARQVRSRPGGRPHGGPDPRRERAGSGTSAQSRVGPVGTCIRARRRLFGRRRGSVPSTRLCDLVEGRRPGAERPSMLDELGSSHPSADATTTTAGLRRLRCEQRAATRGSIASTNAGAMPTGAASGGRGAARGRRRVGTALQRDDPRRAACPRGSLSQTGYGALRSAGTRWATRPRSTPCAPPYVPASQRVL